MKREIIYTIYAMEDNIELLIRISKEKDLTKVVIHESSGIPEIPGLDQKLVSRMNQNYKKILPYEKEILQWLKDSESNAELFMRNPEEAIWASGIDIPENVLSTIRDISVNLSIAFKKK